MRPSKTFNLILPYETYQDLKRISIKQERPIAELVRQGIHRVLINPQCKCSEGANDGR